MILPRYLVAETSAGRGVMNGETRLLEWSNGMTLTKKTNASQTAVFD